jgi:hypothetical protein
MVAIFLGFFQIAKSKLKIFQLRFVKYYLFWNLIMFISGFFVAEGYWEYKVLINNSFGAFLAIASYTLIEPYYTQRILSVYFRNLVWFAIPLLIFIYPNAYGFFLSPFILLLILFPFLDIKWAILSIIIGVTLLFIDLEARSTIIKFGVALLLACSYFFKSLISVKLMNLIHKIFMFAPVLLFITASAGIFNPFNMDAYLTGDGNNVAIDESGKKIDADYKSDTRTALYMEVLESARYYNSWIIGRTPAKGNRTELFSDLKAITGTAERSGNEVAILNIFTWTGIIGVVLYFFIFFRASWLAINKSNSFFMKILGIYLTFRWLFSWVEDVNNYSLNYFLIWIMLAMAYSDKFRLMSEGELLVWTRGIFYKRYQVVNIKKK